MNILDKVLKFLNMIGPLAAIGIAILVAFGVVKWFRRLKEASIELSKEPSSLFFALMVIAFFLFFFFKYISPILNNV